MQKRRGIEATVRITGAGRRGQNLRPGARRGPAGWPGVPGIGGRELWEKGAGLVSTGVFSRALGVRGDIWDAPAGYEADAGVLSDLADPEPGPIQVGALSDLAAAGPGPIQVGAAPAPASIGDPAGWLAPDRKLAPGERLVPARVVTSPGRVVAEEAQLIPASGDLLDVYGVMGVLADRLEARRDG